MVDAYVIGGSLPGLAAALELAEVGLRVRVAEWQQPSDPAAARAQAEALAGPAPRTSDAAGALRGLLGHLEIAAGEPGAAGTSDAEQSPGSSAERVLLRGARGEWSPQPEPALLGIPAVPISSDAVALLGGRAATRAYLDRVKPVLTIGKTHALGELVRTRLGSGVLERLVEPIVRERFGLAADDVEVAAAAPGLNEALTRFGSLSGAVFGVQERDVARETPIVPQGGWAAVMTALRERLAFYEVEFADAAVTAASPRTAHSYLDSSWSIEEADGTAVDARALVAVIDAGVTTEALQLLADVVEASDAADAVDVADAVDAAYMPSLASLLPTRWRYEVSVPLSAAESAGTSDAVDAVLREQCRFDALESVSHETNGQWSMRIAGAADPSASGAADVRAVLSSPVLTTEPDRTGLLPADEAIAVAAELLGASGAVADTASDATVVLRVAPDASTDHREAAVARSEEARNARSDLLIVGAALSAGDTAGAVADARGAAVALRRRLTGISD